jgi:hypothetical protein
MSPMAAPLYSIGPIFEETAVKKIVSAAMIAALCGLGSTAGAQGFTPPTFDSLDANSDGKIMKDEVEKFFANFAGRGGGGGGGGGGGPNADQIFARWDADGNGEVSKEEFDNRPRGRGGPPQN